MYMSIATWTVSTALRQSFNCVKNGSKRTLYLTKLRTPESTLLSVVPVTLIPYCRTYQNLEEGYISPIPPETAEANGAAASSVSGSGSTTGKRKAEDEESASPSEKKVKLDDEVVS